MLGILSPTRTEFSMMLELLGAPGEPSRGPFPAVSGILHNQSYVACRCGIGKTAAAAAAQWLVDTHGVSALLICGAAGSLVPELLIGDVVIADELIPADCGIWNTDGFCFTGDMVEEADGLALRASYGADADMLVAADDVLRESSIGSDAPRLVRGRVVTCEQATFALSRRQELARIFSAVAVEMEGAAAARVAHLNGIGMLAIRAISDELCFDIPTLPEEEGHLHVSELRDSIKRAAQNASRVAAALLRRLAS